MLFKTYELLVILQSYKKRLYARDNLNRLTPKFILIHRKPKFSEDRRKIKPLKQKNKDRLVVIGLLALETGLIYNVVINFYNYVVKGMWYFLVLAILASVGTAVLFVYLLVILFSYLAKRKVLRSFQK